MYSYNPDRRQLSEVRILDLEPWRLYPKGDDLRTAFLDAGRPDRPKITRDTSIASIGSCFAREIKVWLQDRGYNYLVTAEGPCTEAGSARYDRVYNTFTLRQEFERAFGEFAPSVEFWDFEEGGKRRLLDPYRKGVAWEDEQEMKDELEEHRQNVRRAFSEAEVLIVTVGQAEVWYDKRDGYVYPLVPPAEVFDSTIHGFRLSTHAENLENLERVYELFRRNNPSGAFLITVSPVPLRATFRPVNSIVANVAGKSILRSAVESFVMNHPETTYFPAYEISLVTCEDTFADDNRHVRPEAVDEIMALFERWFVLGEAPAS